MSFAFSLVSFVVLCIFSIHMLKNPETVDAVNLSFAMFFAFVAVSTFVYGAMDYASYKRHQMVLKKQEMEIHRMIVEKYLKEMSIKPLTKTINSAAEYDQEIKETLQDIVEQVRAMRKE